MKRTIVVVRRGDDWHASIEGESGRWGCGRTSREAIGDLLLTFAKAFDIAVDYSPGLDSLTMRSQQKAEG